MQPSRVETLLAFLEDDPNDTFVLFALAKEYEKIGTRKKALDTYLQLKEVDSEYVGLYYHLAKLHEDLNDRDSALITYDEGIQVAKKLADFHALSELHNAKTNLEIED